MIAPLSIRVAADTPPPFFYLFANVDKRILPSPNINRLDQEKYTFTRLLLRSLVLQPGFLLDCLLAVFVDGLQMIPFPTPPAIHATWLWLLPRWDSHPLEIASLRWARYYLRCDNHIEVSFTKRCQMVS